MGAPVHDHETMLANARKHLPSASLLCALSDLYKLFGDPTRVRILSVLLECELCVQVIATLLEMEQSAISHQLKILRDAKLVKSRRLGKTNLYSLADDHVHDILALACEHIQEQEETT